MMGEDVRYHSGLEQERRFVFLGKAAIYSAGTTLMSFFFAGQSTPDPRYSPYGARAAARTPRRRPWDGKRRQCALLTTLCRCP
jgi:hypothetical protein